MTNLLLDFGNINASVQSGDDVRGAVGEMDVIAAEISVRARRALDALNRRALNIHIVRTECGRMLLAIEEIKLNLHQGPRPEVEEDVSDQFIWDLSNGDIWAMNESEDDNGENFSEK